jgi:hypothetical protein
MIYTGTLLIIIVLISACANDSVTPQNTSPTASAEVVEVETEPPAEEEATASITEAAPSPEPEALQYQPTLATAKNDFFATAGTCTVCHQNLQDEQGQDISFDSLWRSTSMANAALDPYFLATVRAEITHLPELREVIEDKCATCHLSMARFEDVANGETPKILSEGGYLDPAHPDHALGIDGVSCTVCHQIRSDNFGQESSFSGEMAFDLTNAEQRTIFGARPAEPAVSMAGLGFPVEQSEHIHESELCATCHTLYTPYVKSDGIIAETLFPEQMPYLEWLASDYSDSASCQDCHMPKAPGQAQISNISQAAYENVALHTFVGGNAILLEMLKYNANQIQPNAEIAHLDASIRATEVMMSEQTAQVTVENATLENGTLTFNVLVSIQTGHKFPSSFPSRRTWLHVMVTDANGQVVFESGALEGAMIVGNDNDLDAESYEPHYDLITSPEQVQIYEPILGTDTGIVTTALLEAGQYLKDNRLLPGGFDKEIVSADIAVFGAAAEDDNFVGGEDQVRYEIPVSGDGFMVIVELRYQPIGYRWAHNFEKYDSTEAKNFMGYFEGLPYTSLLVSETTTQVTR